MLVTTLASAQDAGTPDCTSITPGSPEADACAEAAFRVGRATEHALDLRLVLPPPNIHPRPTSAHVIALVREISDRAQHASGVYEDVMAWRRAPWTLRALVAQAGIYERLARAVVAALRTEAQFRDVLEPQIAPVECLAVVRYVLAVRAARAASIRIPEVTQAVDQLHRYRSDRIARCIDDQRTRDSTFSRYQPGELEAFP